MDRKIIKKTKAQKKREKNAEKYKKFSGNRKEGQGFANQRKTKVMHEYNKIKRKEQNKHKDKVQEIYKSEGFDPNSIKTRQPAQPKVSRFHKAQIEAQKKKEEKERLFKQKTEDIKRRQESKKLYMKNKKNKYKKMAVRNYKGQPNMASQMELLLKKIENKS